MVAPSFLILPHPPETSRYQPHSLLLSKPRPPTGTTLKFISPTQTVGPGAFPVSPRGGLAGPNLAPRGRPLHPRPAPTVLPITVGSILPQLSPDTWEARSFPLSHGHIGCATQSCSSVGFSFETDTESDHFSPPARPYPARAPSCPPWTRVIASSL